MLTVLVSARVFGFKELVLLAKTTWVAAEFVKDIPRSLRTRLLVARLAGASQSPSGECGLWEQLVQSVAEWDGTSLRCACVNPRTGAEVYSLEWMRDQKLTEEQQLAMARESLSVHTPLTEIPSAWELQYAVPREHGLIVTLTARGELVSRNSSRGMLELTEMFAAFGPRIPLPAGAEITALISESLIPAQVHARHGEIPEPHILALTLGQSSAKGGGSRRESRVTPDAA
jgi:hypothetical protein